MSSALSIRDGIENKVQSSNKRHTEVIRTVIYGNGAMAESCCLELRGDSRYEVCAFTVDPSCRDSDTLMERPLVGFDRIANEFPPSEHSMLIAVGYLRLNALRAERCVQAKQLGYSLISHISPHAIAGDGLQIGVNSVIAAGSIVSPSARIGNDVFIGAGCIIPHDVEIGDHCFLSDRVVLGGGVRVGERCYVGPNATIRNKVTVARETVIGAGAVILSDTEERDVYMAVAAERLPITSDRLTLA